jgi:hypothetical protein
LQEANRRQQAVRELEGAAGAHAELQRYHDAEMEKAATLISDLRGKLDSEQERNTQLSEELAKAAGERDFLRREIASERTVRPYFHGQHARHPIYTGASVCDWLGWLF